MGGPGRSLGFWEVRPEAKRDGERRGVHCWPEPMSLRRLDLGSAEGCLLESDALRCVWLV